MVGALAHLTNQNLRDAPSVYLQDLKPERRMRSLNVAGVAWGGQVTESFKQIANDVNLLLRRRYESDEPLAWERKPKRKGS